MAAACTCRLDACPAAVGIAEPARIDPAALSARMTGMMIACLMRITPPWRFPEASGQVARPGRPARRIYVKCGISRLSTVLCTSSGYFGIVKSARQLPPTKCGKYSRRRADECSSSRALQGLRQLASRGAGGACIAIAVGSGIRWRTYTEKNDLYQ